MAPVEIAEARKASELRCAFDEDESVVRGCSDESEMGREVGEGVSKLAFAGAVSVVRSTSSESGCLSACSSPFCEASAWSCCDVDGIVANS